MNQVKQLVQNLLDRLPDDCTFEDIQHGIYVIQTLQQRMEMADRGDVVPHEEVRRRVQEWISHT